MSLFVLNWCLWFAFFHIKNKYCIKNTSTWLIFSEDIPHHAFEFHECQKRWAGFYKGFLYNHPYRSWHNLAHSKQPVPEINSDRSAWRSLNQVHSVLRFCVNDKTVDIETNRRKTDCIHTVILHITLQPCGHFLFMSQLNTTSIDSNWSRRLENWLEVVSTESECSN